MARARSSAHAPPGRSKAIWEIAALAPGLARRRRQTSTPCARSGCLALGRCLWPRRCGRAGRWDLDSLEISTPRTGGTGAVLGRRLRGPSGFDSTASRRSPTSGSTANTSSTPRTCSSRTPSTLTSVLRPGQRARPALPRARAAARDEAAASEVADAVSSHTRTFAGTGRRSSGACRAGVRPWRRSVRGDRFVIEATRPSSNAPTSVLELDGERRGVVRVVSPSPASLLAGARVNPVTARSRVGDSRRPADQRSCLEAMRFRLTGTCACRGRSAGGRTRTAISRCIDVHVSVIGGSTRRDRSISAASGFRTHRRSIAAPTATVSASTSTARRSSAAASAGRRSTSRRLSASLPTARPHSNGCGDAGMNMVRVGGTMTYETDALSTTCATSSASWCGRTSCSRNMDYPWEDETFARDVATEVTQRSQALQSRPSLAVVCGSSEVEQQAAMLGLPPAQRSDRSKELLPADLVRADAPQTVWLPTSPSGGTFPFQVDSGRQPLLRRRRVPAAVRRRATARRPLCRRVPRVLECP